MYYKDFDSWHIQKKIIGSRENTPPYFKQGDVWWVSIGINVGYEEDGKGQRFVRPVLVLNKFSKDLFVGLPMSTKQKENKYYFKIDFKHNIVSALMSQIRVFSTKRLWNKLGEIDDQLLCKILKRLYRDILPLPLSRKSRG